MTSQDSDFPPCPMDDKCGARQKVFDANGMEIDDKPGLARDELGDPRRL